MLADRRNRVSEIDGLAGSAAAMLFTQLPNGKEPYLIIANDLDEAGYAYHDLCQMMGESAVLMFPSGYKRDIKYGQVDAPQEILRTEVLNRWHTDRKLHCVVTYPEALAEKVQSRQNIEASTVTLTKDTESDLSEVAAAALLLPRELFYRTLSEQSGFEITDDGDLMSLLTRLAAVKTEYDKVAQALKDVRETGYGIVVPGIDELKLEEPEIMKQGGRYGVRLKASAPSIHMIRADIETAVSPIVGNEKQSEDMVNYLLQEFEGDTSKIWQSTKP